MAYGAPTARTSWISERITALRRSRLKAALVADYRTASRIQKLALVGVVGWLVYEWGPGNETLTPWILAKVVDSNVGIAVIPVTAAIGFAFTTAQQLVSGYTALAGFSTFDRFSRAAWEKLRRGMAEAPAEWSTLGWTARCSLVFGLGTTAVALLQVMTTGQVGVRRHSRAVRQGALLCGSLVGLIGAISASVAYLGRRISALTKATEWIIRLVSNSLFWIGMLILVALIRLLRSRSRAKHIPVEEPV